MPISEVEEILTKYRKKEDSVNSKFSQKNQQWSVYKTNEDIHVLQSNNTETIGTSQAKERNKLILKNLEIVKGNLRSKAIYSPSEMQCKKIQENYKAQPSLIPNKWKCNLP
ncbi:hypothetical protein NQ315_008334 [Exocentrus adspersus]|uniref:Uncharacterized protein n=1 Tax=Exocentrus adspersus TaxID=1586481 RepID=A0AAV8VAJ5_9CUCU|nr:hypothetical protein NQ315_008334 [Exocentrus adspersus]